MAQRREIRVPDIGDFESVEVVEVLVRPGDPVAVDDPLVSIESEKATMEIPSPAAGVVVELAVKEGDKVSEGSLLAVLEAAEGAARPVAAAEPDPATAAKTSVSAPMPATPVAASQVGASDRPAAPTTTPEPATPPGGYQSLELDARPVRQLSTAAANPVPDQAGAPHASPLVRRFARELGVPVGAVAATGPSARVLIDDVKRHVRDRFAGTGAGEERVANAGARPATATATGSRDGVGAGRGADPGVGIPAVPFVDPARFGPVRERALSRIQKVSGPALHRSWLNVPHVTQHDEADITDLERFRRDRRDAAAARGVRLSPLLFVMKAVVIALREFEVLRSTFSAERDRLLVKDYYHLGIAVDTDQGLVVPVVRDVDRKGVFELAAELQATAERARARKLGPEDLAGACFTISSLGGIGGSAFSPIVNAPEVAILGLSKTQIRPVWRGPSPFEASAGIGAESERPGAPEAGRFEPRLVLPLSLSYDHRVIDGALAVRFTTRLSAILSDPMQLLL